MQIKLNGWTAAVAAVALVGFLGVRMLSAQATVETDAAEVLRAHLTGVYTSKVLEQTEGADLASRGASLMSTQNIELVSIKGRGTHRDMVVRVEIRVDGGPPPDGKPVRYFRMQRSSMTGWSTRGRATAFSWYTRVF